MKRPLSFFAVVFTIFVAAVALKQAQSEDKPKKSAEFSSAVIDIGMVVGDVDKSAKFYTDVIGFKELKGFDVPGDFAKNAGLTDGAELKVRVFALGDGDGTTKLKLMQITGVKTEKNANEFIHSQLGYRYISIYVTDANAALTRLAKADVKPLAKGTLPIGNNTTLTCVKDPDGNLIELIGPKK